MKTELAKSLLRILCFCAGLFGHDAWASNMDAYDEAEILYSDARIQANDRRYAEALALAKRAFELDPLHSDACELIVESAKGLFDLEQATSYGKACWESRRKKLVFEDAIQEIENSQKKVDEGDLKEAQNSLGRVLQIRGIQLLGREDLIQETWFRLGLIHLQRTDFEQAIQAFRRAGSEYNQKRAYFQGLMLWRYGYTREAMNYWHYTLRDRGGMGRFDPEIADLSRAAIADGKRIRAGVTGALYYTHDSNPFSLPRESERLDNGVVNRSDIGSVDFGLSVKGLVPRSNRWSFRLQAGATQAHSMKSDYRRVLNSQSAQSGAQIQYSKLGLGKILFRHQFQYGRSPVQESADSYRKTTVTRNQGIGVEHQREWRGDFETRFGYRYGWGKYLTPNDTGLFDRSGTRHLVSARGALRTQSRYFSPAMAASQEWTLANGDASKNRLSSLSLSNQARFFRERVETEFGIGYDWTSYPQSVLSRRDRGWRTTLGASYSMSAHVAAIAQFSHSQTESTDPFYRQSRTVISTGLVFSH